MWRALIAAGAIAALTAPAFAAEETITIEKRTITKDVVVPESGSTVTTTVIAPIAPPPPRVEAPPPPPGPAVVWTPGHWLWAPGQQTYVWVGGGYIDPPRPHAAWIPGRWHQEPQGWAWVEGRWD
jgi:hypothetical protein